MSTKKEEKKEETKNVEVKKATKKETKNTNNKEVKKETKKDNVKTEKKKSIFSKVAGYFKGVRKEISRIRWTKGKELLKYSIAAVSIILFFCIFFYVIDILVALLRSSL